MRVGRERLWWSCGSKASVNQESFAAANEAPLSDDEAVAKMAHLTFETEQSVSRFERRANTGVSPLRDGRYNTTVRRFGRDDVFLRDAFYPGSADVRERLGAAGGCDGGGVGRVLGAAVAGGLVAELEADDQQPE
jgi:hypothetical protein